MKLRTLLKSIGSTEPATFSELCQALGDDCPEKDDKREWFMLFELIRSSEKDGYIEVDRQGKVINSVILTEFGVETLKRFDKER